MNPVALDDGRPVWNSAKAFVLTVAGGGAGFGSFFRLPLMFAAFGVGNFFIAFVICLFLVAYPVTILEIFLGYHYRRASVGALSAVHSKAVGVGYLMPLAGSIVVSLYASIVLCWTAYPFMFDSFASDVEYKKSTPQQIRDYWWSKGVFFHDSDAKLFFIVALVWGIACLLATRGIRTIMVAVYFTVPLPLLFLLGLMIYAFTISDINEVGRVLKPTADGMANYLMWGNALGQALLTVQAGTGNLIAFGSFCRKVHNPFRIATAVLWQALFFSCMFALTTACAMTHLNWKETVLDTYRAGFFVPLALYASLLIQISFTGPLAVTFFLCVLLLGLENLAIAVQVLYSILWDVTVSFRGKKLALVIGLGFVALSMPLIVADAYNVITALDQAVVVVLMPFAVALEAIAAGYLWADKGVLATLRERAVAPGCPTIRAFFSIAYQHSIGKMRQVVESQGRSFALSNIFPVFIKLVVPIASLVSSVGCAIVLCTDAPKLGAAAFVTASVVVLVAVVFVVVQAFVAQTVVAPVPWEAMATMRSADAIGSPGPPTASGADFDRGGLTAMETFELRNV